MKKNMTSGKAAPLTKHDSEAESLFCASMEESCKSTPSDRHCTSRTRVVRILNDSKNPSKRGAHAWLWWLFAEKKHAHHQSKSHLRVFRSGVAVAQWKEAFLKVDSKKPTRSPWMFWCFLRCAPPPSFLDLLLFPPRRATVLLQLQVKELQTYESKNHWCNNHLGQWFTTFTGGIRVHCWDPWKTDASTWLCSPKEHAFPLPNTSM